MSRRAVAIRVVVLGLLVAAFVVFQVQIGMPSAGTVRGRLDDLGWIAVPTFILVYATATLFPVPASVLTIAAGAVFGLWTGVGAVWVGAVLGAAGGFAGSRWLGRDSVSGVSAAGFRRLDAQIGRRGFTTVLVARLVPVFPFASLNYVLGLTAVTFRSYLGATAIGIVPGTAVYVAVGAYGFSPGSWPFAIAIVALVGLTVFGAVHARRVRATDDLRPDATGAAGPSGP